MELFCHVEPLKLKVPVFVKTLTFDNVPLLMLIVPLLLHDVGLIVVVPVPVCLVSVPVLVKVEVLFSELSPFMVMVPLFTMVPEPPIDPSFQIIIPLILMVSAAFIVLPLAVFNVSVCPAVIVRARPNVPLDHVAFALIVKEPVPTILPCILNALLIVRSPAPLIVLVLLNTKEALNTCEIFKVSVLTLLKFPVPVIWEPEL